MSQAEVVDSTRRSLMAGLGAAIPLFSTPLVLAQTHEAASLLDAAFAEFQAALAACEVADQAELQAFERYLTLAPAPLPEDETYAASFRADWEHRRQISGYAEAERVAAAASQRCRDNLEAMALLRATTLRELTLKAAVVARLDGEDLDRDIGSKDVPA